MSGASVLSGLPLDNATVFVNTISGTIRSSGADLKDGAAVGDPCCCPPHEGRVGGVIAAEEPPLPPELMGMIFNFYDHLYEQLPERLLHVCRASHVLALSQPTLWTNLDPLDQFGHRIVRPWAGTYLQSRIARSNPAPLKVDFRRRHGI